MKKILSVLGLFAILSMTAPVMAAPGGHGPGHGPAPQRMHHAQPHMQHRMPPAHHHVAPPRPHSSVTFYGGYPRPRYCYGSPYRVGYWNGYWCNYRLGYYDEFGCGYYRPGMGVNIRF